MEILKNYKCVEYGIGNDGMLFLCECLGGGFVMTDTPENRKYMEKEFNNWANSGVYDNCQKCQYKHDCGQC